MISKSLSKAITINNGKELKNGTVNFSIFHHERRKIIEILKIAHNYEEQGKKVLLFALKVDNRYGEGIIASRIGLSRQAIVVKENTNILEEVINTRIKIKINCVLVDEAQFLTRDHVYQLTEVVDKLEIPLLLMAKNTFNNKLSKARGFTNLCNKIEEVKNVCWYCDRKSTMNLRLDESGNPVTEGEIIQIGGNESYLPVCRKCYKTRTEKFRYDSCKAYVKIGFF